MKPELGFGLCNQLMPANSFKIHNNLDLHSFDDTIEESIKNWPFGLRLCSFRTDFNCELFNIENRCYDSVLRNLNEME